MAFATKVTKIDRRRAVALLTTAVVAGAGRMVLADESPAYVVLVDNVKTRVGENAVMLATLKVRDAYRILKAYNNRVIKLSSFDDGVVFERETVPATVEEQALVFAVGLRATKPGRHPINGLFRVGYSRAPMRWPWYRCG